MLRAISLPGPTHRDFNRLSVAHTRPLRSSNTNRLQKLEVVAEKRGGHQMLFCDTALCDVSTQPETEHNLEDVPPPNESSSVADASAISVAMPWDTADASAISIAVPWDTADASAISVAMSTQVKQNNEVVPTSMPQDVNVEASTGEDAAPGVPLVCISTCTAERVEAPSSKGEDATKDVLASYYQTGAVVAAGLIAIIAVAAAVVCVVLLGTSSDSVGKPKSSATVDTNTPVAPVTNYYVSSAVTMAGISVSQFNGAAQTQFKSTVATKMSVPTTYMAITNYATTPQASLRVNFNVFDSSPIPQSKMIMLPKFLKASDSTGFKAMLNSNLASASIQCNVSAISGVMVKIAPRAPVPQLALVSSVAKDPSRRSLAPAGSSLSTFTATEETLLPGGIGETIKMPKELLCMLEQAQVTDRAVWGARTSAPASGDDAGVVVARYDHGTCTSTKRNVTNEWLMYQAWHTGNPDVVGVSCFRLEFGKIPASAVTGALRSILP